MLRPVFSRARPLLALALLSGCSRAPVLPPAPSPRAVSVEPFTKPLTFSVLEDYDKGEDLSGIANDFRLIHELGIDTWRGSFAWDDHEPERGVYDFEWLRSFVELAARERIRLRPYIAYTPEWAAAGRLEDEAHWNDPPAELAQWTAFVRALASEMRHHPNVLSYEIYNEENTPVWWDGTAAEYAHVLAGASAAIRETHPGAQVLMGGLVWPDSEWMRRTCGELGGGAMFDVAPFHAYPETWTGDSVTVETYLDAEYYDAWVPAVDSSCGGKSIWLNEVGYPTVGGASETAQANWWARAIATFAASRRVEHLGIYELRDQSPDDAANADDPSYHMGLVHLDGTRKLAFSTVQLLVALLNTGTITVADGDAAVRIHARREGELYHHLFVRPDGRQVLLVWDRTRSPVLNIELARGGSTAIEYVLDGRARRYVPFVEGELRRVALLPGEVRIFVIEPGAPDR